MSHNALVPLQPDAAAGGLLQRGPLCHIEQTADQELPVGAVLAHLGPETETAGLIKTRRYIIVLLCIC